MIHEYLELTEINSSYKTAIPCNEVHKSLCPTLSPKEFYQMIEEEGFKWKSLRFKSVGGSWYSQRAIVNAKVLKPLPLPELEVPAAAPEGVDEATWKRALQLIHPAQVNEKLDYGTHWYARIPTIGVARNFSYLHIKKEPIGTNYKVVALCGVETCCNPKHLYVVHKDVPIPANENLLDEIAQQDGDVDKALMLHHPVTKFLNEHVIWSLGEQTLAIDAYNIYVGCMLRAKDVVPFRAFTKIAKEYLPWSYGKKLYFNNVYFKERLE